METAIWLGSSAPSSNRSKGFKVAISSNQSNWLQPLFFFLTKIITQTEHNWLHQLVREIYNCSEGVTFHIWRVFARRRTWTLSTPKFTTEINRLRFNKQLDLVLCIGFRIDLHHSHISFVYRLQDRSPSRARRGRPRRFAQAIKNQKLDSKPKKNSDLDKK